MTATVRFAMGDPQPLSKSNNTLTVTDPRNKTTDNSLLLQVLIVTDPRNETTDSNLLLRTVSLQTLGLGLLGSAQGKDWAIGVRHPAAHVPLNPKPFRALVFREKVLLFCHHVYKKPVPSSGTGFSVELLNF